MDIYWKPLSTTGLEHLALHETTDGVTADGIVLRQHEGKALRLRYQLRCDAHWTPRELSIETFEARPLKLTLTTDGKGHWFVERGLAIAYLDGCLSLDIMATPFTNTLAIRHLNLSPGESKTLDVAFVSIPDLRAQQSSQRYTCLERDGAQSTYLYESLASGFQAKLWIDPHNLVQVYEGQWERVRI